MGLHAVVTPSTTKVFIISIVMNVVHVLTRRHDKGIIDRDTGNDTNTLLLQLLKVSHIARKMGLRASRGKCSGNS